MVFALERPSSSKLVAARIIETLTEVVTCRDAKQSSGAMKIAGHDSNDSLGGLGRLKTLLFLVSDILFNSVQSTEAWSYVRHFEQAMPLLMLQLNAKLVSSVGKMSREQIVKDVKRVFQIWAEKSIYDERLTTGWLATLIEDKETYVTFGRAAPDASQQET